MRVNFVKPEKFFSKIGLKPLDSSSLSLQKFIPKQLPDTNTTKSFSKSTIIIDKMLQIAFWILLIYNICASGTMSMEHFIVMINSL